MGTETIPTARLEAAVLAYDNACPGEHWRKHDRMRAALAAYLSATPQAEIDRLRHVAEEAYWLLAWTWQSHMFSAGPALAMEAFAPEVRPMMNKAEQDLFDALIALHPETPNGGLNG